jgi:hypothetical protein
MTTVTSVTSVTRASLVVVVLLVVGACAPRLTPLTGAPAPSRFPTGDLAPGRHKIVFRWELEDPELSGRGEGVARIASPDSVRLDFFLAGGIGAGAAVLIDDALQTPGPEMVRRLVPPPPLLWAALGRAAVPAHRDTVVRVDGNVLRADIGQPVAWRLTFRRDTLVRAERVEKGRVAEWVERSDSAHVRYRNAGSHRSLQLVITRVDQVPEFDPSIWHLDRQ